MTALSTTLVTGLGSLRFDPRIVPYEDMRHLAKSLSEHSAIGTFLRGPIRLYGRGEKDARLEYDFRIPDDEQLAEVFYRNIRMTVEAMIPTLGRWHHSHWVGVELIS